MIAFVASFIEFVVKMIVLVAVAIGGVFLGKFLRGKKDAKTQIVSDRTNE